MYLNISLIGYIVLAIIYSTLIPLLIVLHWLLWRRRKWYFATIPLALALIAAPVADEVWIAWNFEKLCKGAGVFVKRKVSVDGFYDDTGGIGQEQISKDGYKYIERRNSITNNIERIENTGSEFKRTTLSRPSARYHLKNIPNQITVSSRIDKLVSVIADSSTNEILGKDIRYRRFTGWLESWRQDLSGPIICKGPLDDPVKQRRIGLIDSYVLSPNR